MGNNRYGSRVENYSTFYLIFYKKFSIIYIENKKENCKMKISIRSCYSYAICESEVDIEKFVKEVQAYLDRDFGQARGLSLKKGEWERVIVTEKDIINCLSDNDDCDINIYYCHMDNNEQCWDETTLFAEISDYIYEYCEEKEKVVEWGNAVSRRVFIQNNLIHEDF